MVSPREHPNYRERGGKKFSFTYRDLAAYTGYSLSYVRNNFRWAGLGSLVPWLLRERSKKGGRSE